MMKISLQTLLKIKSKTKKLKTNNYKSLKRRLFTKKNYLKTKVPRLIIRKSHRNIYTQIVSELSSQTIFTISTLNRQIYLNLGFFKRPSCITCYKMGQKLAQQCLKENIQRIVFDRGPYLYHGQVRAVASGARSTGLRF
uniref:Ribosomal protein L18 n=1 Tax=Astrosyne radiata TaxID=1158023 RepID=A0A2U9NTA9_9STRA|nr:ribosomal protein L18 [Astrosyne radiata]AWT40364.1 ribosomal protein L18 [Astrosyne radiata]